MIWSRLRSLRTWRNRPVAPPFVRRFFAVVPGWTISAPGLRLYSMQLPVFLRPKLGCNKVHGKNVYAMTGRERVLAVFAGQKADHIPCMPITMTFAADI